MRFARRSASKNTPANVPSFVPDRAEPAYADLPEQLIAARAYEMWRRRGCPMGQDSKQDWYAAKAELEQERLGWTAPQPEDRNKI